MGEGVENDGGEDDGGAVDATRGTGKGRKNRRRRRRKPPPRAGERSVVHRAHSLESIFERARTPAAHASSRWGARRLELSTAEDSSSGA